MLYFCVSESSAYTITEIDGIKGENVKQVHSDAEGNTYVLGEKKLYKLNASNEISSVTDIPKSTWAPMLVSRRGDAYLFFRHVRDSDGSPKYIGFIMRVGATGLELIDDADWYYLDRNKNTLYYAKDFNIYVLRPNSASVPITNLKDYSFDSYYKGIVTDKSGNTYIPVVSKSENSLAMISKEALQEEMPQATYLNVLDDDEMIVYLKVDEENNLWIVISTGNKTFTKWVIKKLTKGNLKIILMEEAPTYNEIMMISKQNTCYIWSAQKSENFTTIYYVTEENKAVPIPELKHLDGSQWINSVSDSEGQVYFYSANNQLSDYLGKMVTVKPNDTKPIPISLRACENQMLHSVQVDFNDDVWILINEKLYYLKKGETLPNFAINVRSNCSIKADSRIHINFVTKRIYISCSDGLIVVN